MGEERWRRSLRSALGVITPALLAPLFFLMARGSLPEVFRAGAALFGVVSVAAAVDATRAGIVVGSEGILVRRVLIRRRLRWSGIERFEGERRGLAGNRIEVRAVLAGGGHRPVADYAMPEAEANQLLEDLSEELEGQR